MVRRQISLFEDFDLIEKEQYAQFHLDSERDILKFIKQFIKLDEDDTTPYKHKDGHYNKKAHYINNKKVNRQVYFAVKKWLDNI